MPEVSDIDLAALREVLDSARMTLDDTLSAIPGGASSAEGDAGLTPAAAAALSARATNTRCNTGCSTK